MSLLLCSVLCAVRNPVACRSRRGDGGARRGIRRSVSASRRQWTGRADRPRVRARSRCLAARARARTRAAALAKSARHGKRCRWESPRDAPPSSASCVRVDARSASIAGVTRAAECDSRACRGTGVAMERRRPGPGEGSATRVAWCARETRHTQQDGWQNDEDGSTLASCANSFRGSRRRGCPLVSFSSRERFRGSRFSRFWRDQFSIDGSRTGKRKRGRENGVVGRDRTRLAFPKFSKGNCGVKGKKGGGRELEKAQNRIIFSPRGSD